MSYLKISAHKKDIVEYYDSHYTIQTAVESFKALYGDMVVNVSFISREEFFNSIKLKGGGKNETLWKD